MGHDDNHSIKHTNGIDDIQDSTDIQKGLATPTQITKLDSVETDATKNDATNQFPTIFVSDYMGSDLNDGSENAPFKTFQKGIDNCGLNGCIIELDPTGSPDYGSVVIPNDALITIRTAETFFGLSFITEIEIGSSCYIQLNGVFCDDIKESLGATDIGLTIINSTIQRIRDNDGINPASHVELVIANSIFGDWLTDLSGLQSSFGSFMGNDGIAHQIMQMHMGGNAITDVQDPTNPQDADTENARDNAISTHAGLSSVHHTKYLDSEAVSAMGAKGDGNPLNHDRPIQATESVVGIAELASQAETDAGTDDTKMITPLKLANYPIVDPNAIHDNAVDEIHQIASKATPIDADEIVMEDSVASWAKKRLSWANIKATLKTYFDTLYPAKTLTRRYTVSTRFRVGTGGSAASSGQIEDVPVILFSATQDQEAVFAHHIKPSIDLSAVNPQLEFHAIGTGAAGVGTETVRLQLEIRYRGDGENVGGAYDETLIADIDLPTGVANVHHDFTIVLDRTKITVDDEFSVLATRIGTVDDYNSAWGISQVDLAYSGTGGV